MYSPLQLPGAVPSSRLVEIVLFAILLLAGIVALRLLLTVMNPSHRRRYSRHLRYSLLIGFVLGLLLPWNETIGILGAAITSIILLLLAFHYTFLHNRDPFQRLARLIPVLRDVGSRESLRDLFFYFSIVTAIVGIVTTILSVVAPPFLFLSLGFMVPLSFDTLSMLSAILEFTFTTPHRRILLSLIRKHLHEQLTRRLHVKGGSFSDTTMLTILLHDASMLTISQSDLQTIVQGTTYSLRDIEETIESLAQSKLVIKEGLPENPLYRFTTDGFRVVQSEWEEAQIIMALDCGKVESDLSRMTKFLDNFSQTRPNMMKTARALLNTIRTTFERIRDEYGKLLDSKWLTRVESMMKELGREMQ